MNSIRGLDLEISAMDHERCRLADRRRDLLEKAESLGAGLTGVCVQHSVGSRTESLGVQLADTMSVEEVCRKLGDYQEKVNRRIDELIDRKTRAKIIIERIPDARYRAVLIHRYISNLKWSTIADIMGHAQNWVEIDLKRKAVEAFERAEKTTM
ncbi:MAG: hypothetical protein AB9880_00040 [Christensenellales bacterium]